MALSRNTFYIVLVLFSYLTVATEKDFTKLKEIISKQAIYNIRFVSQDSSFTIFQKHSGGLYLSTNYSVKRMLDSESNTQFNVVGSKKYNRLLIIKQSNYHQEFNPNIEHSIFYAKYGESKTTLIGKGVFPKFHLDGNYISYYKPSIKKLIISKISIPQKTYEISTRDQVNPFFVPQIILKNKSIAYILNQNASGLSLVNLYDLGKNKKTTIYKASNYFNKLEMCLSKGQLIIFNGTYSESEEPLSEILSYKKSDQPDDFLFENIYQSKQQDIGQIICNYDAEKIYFLKNFGVNKRDYFDIAELNLSTKEVVRKTKEDFITSIFEMDGRLFALKNGVQMLVFGENSLKTDSIPSQSKKSGKLNK